MKFSKSYLSVVILSLSALGIASCASNPEMRQQLTQIHSVSITQYVDFQRMDAAEVPRVSPFQQKLVNDFARKVNRAGIFPQPVATVRASLQTWREEVGEMSYDAQFKLNLHPAAKEGSWMLEALLESHNGVIVWRSSTMVGGGMRGLDESSLSSACEKLVSALKRAHR